jgi:hypothetical protein
MKTNILIIAAVFVIFGYAASFASNLTGPEGGWMNKTLTGPTVRGGSAAPVAGALLLEDGVSILLLEDGASNFCLEGGC